MLGLHSGSRAQAVRVASVKLSERQIVKALLAFLAVIALVAGTRGAEDAGLSLRIVAAARQQIGVTKEYDPGYRLKAITQPE